MRSADHVSDPPVDQRTRELAQLLATGLLRLRDRHLHHASSGDSPPEQPAKIPHENRLELP